jgi:pSer/pThr/pTyr-binding forkhead associated (FHA) protein
LDVGLNSSSISFDWFIFALRLAFIVLIYFFLYQVARVSIRELVAIGTAAQDPSAPVMPSPTSALEVLDPARSSLQEGSRLPLEHYTTIGRRDDNSVVIDDTFISGNHAEIVFDQGVWWLSDPGSTNGTFLNGSSVGSRVQIANDDVVQFGRVTLRVNV